MSFLPVTSPLAQDGEAGDKRPQSQAGPGIAGGGGTEAHQLRTCEREMLASRRLWIVSLEMWMED